VDRLVRWLEAWVFVVVVVVVVVLWGWEEKLLNGRVDLHLLR